MWSSVAPDDIKSAAPSARSKHSATVVGDHVYLLGGRNGNLPTRDFWKYNLGLYIKLTHTSTTNIHPYSLSQPYSEFTSFGTVNRLNNSPYGSRVNRKHDKSY